LGGAWTGGHRGAGHENDCQAFFHNNPFVVMLMNVESDGGVHGGRPCQQFVNPLFFLMNSNCIIASMGRGTIGWFAAVRTVAKLPRTTPVKFFYAQFQLRNFPLGAKYSL
jgi:hypothetical protein